MNFHKLKRFATKHWLPVSGFVISSALALWFGFTFMADAIYFNDPRHKDQALKGWMSPRYIVMSYDLPRDVVFEGLGLSTSKEDGAQKGGPNDPGRIRMKDLAAKMNITLDELTAKVRSIAETYRAAVEIENQNAQENNTEAAQ